MSSISKIPPFNALAFSVLDICQLRSDLGLSQIEMGKVMGRNHSQISRWESAGVVSDKLAREKYWQLYHELELGIRKPQKAEPAKEVANG